jgi:phosphonate ABC transporter permease subunit PhnE
MSETPPDPKNALRRLLIVIGAVIGFIIYSYGWTVTNIDLEVPQEERRQNNVSNALRELLAPNIFEQDREVEDIFVNVRVECIEGEAVDQPDLPDGTTIDLSVDCGEIGDEVTLEIRGFAPLAEGRIRWIPPGADDQARPRDILETEREDFRFDADGDFTGTIEIPRVRGTEGEISQINVRAAVPTGPIRLSDTAENVLDAMVETIFMALVATTVAIPIAAMISFFAARNIMRPIKLAFGSLMLAFIGLAVGFWLGQVILTDVIAEGIRIGSANVTELNLFGNTLVEGETLAVVLAFGVPLALFALVMILAPYVLRETPDLPPWLNTTKSVTIRLLSIALIVLFMGLIAGLGLLGSEQINNLSDNIRPDPVIEIIDGEEEATTPVSIGTIGADIVSAVGVLLNVLSDLVRLFAPLLGAVAGGFVVSGIATDLLVTPLRKTPPVLSRVLGAILGAVGGAILFVFLGNVATLAALLGLITPIVAAILGGQLSVIVYRAVLPRDPEKARYTRDRTDDLARLATFIIGAVITFILSFNYMNIGRALIDGTLPLGDTVTLIDFLGIEIVLREYVLDTMWLGVVLVGIIGGISGVQAVFPMGSVLYNVSRTMLNTIRSIEPLIMGLVFVIWVGIGPFAGVLALTLHSIAALGKLYSEQVENIDDGPVEALQSTGANRLQTIWYAVVPQIIPPYIAFTMYRWDINVRMSTIIGFVGGGGIGLLLQQQINLLQYRDAGVAVLAIAVVVSILDYASATIRARIT